MRQIASAEFQKTYGRLTEPVAVTVHGRVIGIWTPQGSTGVIFKADEERYDTRPVAAVPKAVKAPRRAR